MSYNILKPQTIIIDIQKRAVQLTYEENTYLLSFEFLRTHSPSADTRNPQNGEFLLLTDKQDVLIHDVKQVGHYAVRFIFSDGHQSGIFSWTYLWWLITEKEELWRRYQDRLRSRIIDKTTEKTDPRQQ